MRPSPTVCILLAGLASASAQASSTDPTTLSVERFYAELGVLERWAAIKPLVEPHNVRRQDILLCMRTADSLADKRRQDVRSIVDECVEWAKKR